MTAEGEILRTSGGQSDEWTYRRYLPEDLWSVRPLEPRDVPTGKHPIDFFIDTRRSEAGYEAAPEADPRVLIRRASYDLLGLPPVWEDCIVAMGEMRKVWNGLHREGSAEDHDSA